jgi:hypothetical protein
MGLELELYCANKGLGRVFPKARKSGQIYYRWDATGGRMGDWVINVCVRSHDALCGKGTRFYSPSAPPICKLQINCIDNRVFSQ